MELSSALDAQSLLKQTFPSLPATFVDEVANLANIETHAPGVVLCRQGAIEHTFYIIGAGRVEILHELTGGQERRLREAGPGEFFGELAIIMDAPRAATVRTLQTTTVIALDKVAFVHMLEQNPAIGMTLMRTVMGWLRANEEHSIAELEAKTRQIEAAYNALAQREQQRTAFLTTVATGLRAPLAAAQEELNSLKHKPGEALDTAEFHASARTLRSSLDRIVQRVNDLLFMQSLEPIQSSRQPVALSGLLKTVVTEARARAAQRRIQVAAAIAPDLPTVLGDEEGLARAFGVILDFAVASSLGNGVIVLTARVHRRHIEVTLAYPGEYLSQEALTRLFDPFEQRADVAFGAGGGFGVAIARYWLEYHGGTVSVQSQPGKGNTFTVRLPFEEQS